MEAMLAEIRSGAFAAEWREEVARGRPLLNRAVLDASKHPMEATRRQVLGDGSGER
jgi:ketol-acid reductoisomerase